MKKVIVLNKPSKGEKSGRTEVLRLSFSISETLEKYDRISPCLPSLFSQSPGETRQDRSGK